MDLQHILQQGQSQVMLSQQQAQPFKVQNVSVEIASAFHQLNYVNCTLEVTEGNIGLVLAETEETEKVVTVMFANVSSVGVQGMISSDIEGDRVMVFLEGEENQQEQQNQGEQENPMPEILKLIRDSVQGAFNLTGNYTISLGFSSGQKMKQVHELMVGYLHSDQNQDEENFMDEMISADQINEDGTINNFNQKGEADEDSEEDEGQENGNQ